MLLGRYLERHAEPAPPLPNGCWRYALTVPAYDESPEFPDNLLRHATEGSVLLVVAVNVPDSAPPEARRRTRALADALTARPHVLLIDRVRNPIPHRQGVGLARRLAADAACRLIDLGRVATPWVFMTDADVILPPGYFEQATGSAGQGVQLYPFHHEPDSAANAGAAATYELHLRRYVLGLARAGSPYAFHSLGSTIAIHAETYAAVRGIPRRNAGEDFYLLNKSAKVGPVTNLRAPSLTIRARPSSRVPFGTGPAIARIGGDVERFVSYAGEAFEGLRSVHRAVERWSLADAPLNPGRTLLDLMAGLGWPGARLATQHPPGVRRLRAALEWLDGFRCMRIVRTLNQSLPPTPLLATLRDELDLPGATAAELLARLRTEDLPARSGVVSAIER